MAWTNPLSGRITSGYSLTRRHPITGRIAAHRGTDVAPSPGHTLVGAAENGTVIGVRTGSYRGDGRLNTFRTPYGTFYFGTGNAVLLRHSGGVHTYYGHLAAPLVGVGQSVSAGQAIGRVGTTGMSTGVHLHFEILTAGASMGNVNPVTYLAARGVSLGYGRTSISTGPVIPASAYPSVQMRATPLVFEFTFTTPRIG